MTNPVSYAMVPAQPDKEFYGLQELALFQSFTRDSYRAKFGVEAPVFDPAKSIKQWFDSAADTSLPENVVVYKVAGRKADGSYVETVQDATGKVVSNYDANGLKVSAVLQNIGQGTVTKAFGANGATTSTTEIGNGIILTVTDDGHGNKTSTTYKRNDTALNQYQNFKLSEDWSKNDASHGTNYFSLDGSSSGVVKLASTAEYSFIDDGAGNITYQYNLNSAATVEIPKSATANGTFTFKNDATLNNINISAIIGSNGAPDLLITTSAGKSFIIDGGLDYSVNRFVFSDGTILTLDQMMKQVATTPVTLTVGSDRFIFDATQNNSVQSGIGKDTIYGWGNNKTYVVNDTNDIVLTPVKNNTIDTAVNYSMADNAKNVQNLTLTGSAYLTVTGNSLDNVIIANNGNDTINGGAGNDIIYGGTGLVTFVMGLGMGSDTVIDNSLQGAVIQLSSSLSLSDLLAVKVGNDLQLKIIGSADDGLLIKDYFSNPQTSWTIRDVSNNTTSLQSILDATLANPISQDIASLEMDFLTQATNKLTQNSLQEGGTLQPDGSIASQTINHIYQDIPYGITGNSTTQHKVSYFNGGTATYTTQSTWAPLDVIANSNTIVNVQQIQSVENAPVINVISSTNGNDTYDVTWATVNFNQAYWSTNSVNQAVPIIDTNGVVIGIDQQVITPVGSVLTFYGYIHSIPLSTVYTDLSYSDGHSLIPLDFVHHKVTDLVQKIYVGVGDHTVNANQTTVVNAGSGNNVINDAGFVYAGTGNDIINNAGIAYGGSGNDTFIGGNNVIVGTGNDNVFVGQGESNIEVDPMTSGNDLVGGAGINVTKLKSLLQGNYYANANNYANTNTWLVSYQLGGLNAYHLSLEGFNSYYTNTQDVLNYVINSYGWADATIQDLFDRGSLTYGPVQALPSIVVAGSSPFKPSPYYASLDVNVVNLWANDYLSLAPYYDLGLIPVHNVTFDAGISVDDIQLTWGQKIGSISGLPTDPQSLYTTLNISWGVNNQSLSVLIPHAEDPLGSGISQFTFADGTVLNIGQMIAMAPPAPTFDPQLFDISPGMGTVVLDASSAGVRFSNGITQGNVKVSRDGVDLLMTYGTGGDILRVTNWYINPYDMPKFFASFDFGPKLSTLALTAAGLVQDGSAGNQTLTGLVGFPNTLIAGPNDTLVGSSGEDTYVYNAGDGVVHINDTGKFSTLRFGAGITQDMVTLGIGSFMIRVGSSGDIIHIENFNPNDVLGSGSVLNFKFNDGTTLSYTDLVASGFDIYGTTGDETLTGTNLVNRIYAGTGNDLLIGSGTNDTLYGGIGNDTLQAGAGQDILIGGSGKTTFIAGTAGDTLIGGTGQNTFEINLGDGQTTLDDSVNTRSGKAALDTIQFGAGINAGTLNFTHQGADMLIGYGNASDRLLIKDFNVTTIPNDIPRFTFTDGSSGGVSINSNGSYSTYANNGVGNTFVSNYDANGNFTGDNFTYADGSYGSDIANPDGSESGITYFSNGSVSSNYIDNANGSSSSYTSDGAGDTTTTYYDANGIKLSDSWTKSNGSAGTDTFNSNGTIASSTITTPLTHKAPTAASTANIVGHNQTLNETTLVNGLITAGLAGDTETITAVTGNTTLNGSTITYTSPASGTDSFSYTVKDQLGDTATGVVNVTIDSGPVLTASAPAKLGHGQSATVGTVTAGLAGDTLTLVTTTAPLHGTISLLNGVVTYTAVATLPTGVNSDTFTYQIQDQYGDVSAAVNTSLSLDAGPIAATGTIIVGHNQTLNETTLVNGLITAGLAGDTETITAVTGNTTLNGSTITYTSPASGTDSFSYTVKDQLGDTATGVVNVTIDSGPVLTASAPAKVGHGKTVTVGTVTAGITSDTLVLVTTTAPLLGTLALMNGVVTYTNTGTVPPAGTTDTFTYQIKDQYGDLSKAVTSKISLDAGPTAATGTITVGHAQTVNETTLVNGLIKAGLSGDIETVTSVTGHAILTGTTINYTAPATGPDSFSYTVQDQVGDTATGVVNVTVDTGPVLTASAPAKVGHGQKVTVGNVTAGITGDTLTLVTTTAPLHGTLALVSGVVTYTAIATLPAGVNSDSFSYQIKDQYGDLSTAVTTSLQLDAGPTSATGAITVGHGQAVDETAYVNSLITAGLAGDTETITAVTGHAVLSGSVINYTAPASGTDSFNFTVKDQLGDTVTGKTNITIDTGPVLTASTAGTIAYGKSATVGTVTAGITSDTLSLVVTTAPTQGSLSLVNGVVTYTAAATIAAGVTSDTFTYQVKDQYGDLSKALTTKVVVSPGETINASNQSITISANYAATVTGNADTIIGGTGDTLVANGNTDIITVAATSTLTANGNNDSITIAGASTLTMNGTGENFILHPAFGLDVISGFSATDSFQFDKTIFADWTHLKAAMTQSGTDTIITEDAKDKITLKNVTASSLTQSQFHFV